jgi:hypothetical protein
MTPVVKSSYRKLQGNGEQTARIGSVTAHHSAMMNDVKHFKFRKTDDANRENRYHETAHASGRYHRNLASNEAEVAE